MGNRSWFERTLEKNISVQLTGLEHGKIKTHFGRIFIFGINPDSWQDYASRLKAVMGIKNILLAVQTESSMEAINEASLAMIKNVKRNTFRISSRRFDKSFPKTSQEVNIEIGDSVRIAAGMKVKLENPDLEIIIEIINKKSYVGFDKIQSYGGLPVGVSEKAVSLLSSGIDSPVSSFEMLKRGVKLTYVHFHSAPVTSRQSIRLVERIITILSEFGCGAVCYHIPLLEVQQKIMESIPNKLWVIFFRRAMMELASEIAELEGASALVTGENIGQVASQTLSNIRAADDASHFPIIRPIAGSNKEDIINRANEIGTYQISIEPYQDCCSYFVPVHPETKADLDYVKKLDEQLDITAEMNNALKQMNQIEFNQNKETGEWQLN